MPRATLQERATTQPDVATTSSDPKARVLTDSEPVAGVFRDPKTGEEERRSVTLEGLKKEFGAKQGRELYFQISMMLESGANEGYTPDLALPVKKTKDLNERREAVEKLLAEASGYQPDESATEEAKSNATGEVSK